MKLFNIKTDSPYYKRMHKLGFWVTVGSLILFLGVPTIVCLSYGIMPKVSEVLLAAGGLMAIFIPIGIAETFAEVPVMGSSYYLACITGNILNLKLPATFNALKVADVEQGTEEADAITGVAIAISSLVTLLMLALGVVLLTPLKPFLASEAVTTAAAYVLPALFGCLTLSLFNKDVGGGTKVYGKLKAAIIPFILCIILFFFVIPSLYETIEGILMIICIPILYFISKKMYKKGIITVELADEAKDKVVETIEQ